MDYTVYEVTERRTGLSDFHFHFRLNSCWSLASFCVWEISRHGGNGGNLETACSVKRGSLPSVPADCCLEMTSIHYCQVISFLQRELELWIFFRYELHVFRLPITSNTLWALFRHYCMGQLTHACGDSPVRWPPVMPFVQGEPLCFSPVHGVPLL